MGLVIKTVSLSDALFFDNFLVFKLSVHPKILGQFPLGL
jgi:hypothetical protein